MALYYILELLLYTLVLFASDLGSFFLLWVAFMGQTIFRFHRANFDTTVSESSLNTACPNNACTRFCVI